MPRPGSPLNRTLTQGLEHVLMVAIVVVSLAPLYMMLTSSFKSAAEFRSGSIGLPRDPTLENYSIAWNDLGFRNMFTNSAVLSLSSAAICTLLAAAAAYGFTRFRFAGRGVLLVGTIAMMAIPAIVIIIPVFLVMSEIGWINTYQAAIVAEVGLLLPFAVFLLYSYMRDLPKELFEAAAVDGAGHFRIFLVIVLPLARPALATSAIVSAIFAWNDLLVPLILWQSDRLQTLMVGLATLGPGRTGVGDVPLLMAGVTISVAPLVALFLLGRRAIVRGLTEGSLK